jgi:hypothetical protein
MFSELFLAGYPPEDLVPLNPEFAAKLLHAARKAAARPQIARRAGETAWRSNCY